MTEELKPCPFCGAKASLEKSMGESLWSHEQVIWTRVSCSECECETRATCPGYEPDAIQAWNQRASLAKPQPVGGALTEALQLAREYVKNASQRMYDGTSGEGIRKDATRRLALIDEALALATLSEPVAQPGEAVSDAQRQQIIAEFLESTGQYVTNDASRESALTEAYAEGWQDGSSETVTLLAEPEAACWRCGGSGVVDDGEFDCSEGGIPYENGPIKCVKDCPVCKGRPLATPIAAQPAAAEAVETQPGSPHFDGADAWNAAPTAAAEPAMTPSAKWGRLYTMANAVTALIGYRGQIDSDADEIASLMDALHDLDGGEWMPGMIPSAAQPGEAVSDVNAALEAVDVLHGLTLQQSTAGQRIDAKIALKRAILALAATPIAAQPAAAEPSELFLSDLRRKLAALPWREFEAAPGVFTRYVHQGAMLDAFDAAPAQAAAVPFDFSAVQAEADRRGHAQGGAIRAAFFDGARFASSQAAAVPEGWKLVPVEPTQEMVSAYLKANDAYWKRTDELPSKNASRWREGKPNEATAESYKAMLLAAPMAQAAAVPEAVVRDAAKSVPGTGWTEVKTQGSRRRTYRVYFLEGEPHTVEVQVGRGWRVTWRRSKGSPPSIAASCAIRAAIESIDRLAAPEAGAGGGKP